MSKFNGHKNWNHWNVSLWINNDEGLYSMARTCLQCYPRARASAVRHMLEWLHDQGMTHTPDGARYTVTSILNAMKGM